MNSGEKPSEHLPPGYEEILKRDAKIQKLAYRQFDSDIRPDLIALAQGKTSDHLVRLTDKFYPGWTAEDFQRLCEDLGIIIR